jgi:hypothetical protein
MLEGSSEEMETSIETLQKTVSDYKVHIDQILALHNETVECFEEIQKLINVKNDQNPGLLPALQIPPAQFDFSKRLPSVLFIGSQNCGKSTLLNVFLQKPKLLPTHENPCTSRIVRLIYSSTNYVKLVDADMQELEMRTFKDKVPKNLVVLDSEDREDNEKLHKIVEVGLNHELLKCGIELIDSPGRNENEALDCVVEEFVEKGIVPLIVYIVDGRDQVRDKVGLF